PLSGSCLANCRHQILWNFEEAYRSGYARTMASRYSGTIDDDRQPLFSASMTLGAGHFRMGAMLREIRIICAAGRLNVQAGLIAQSRSSPLTADASTLPDAPPESN